MSEVVVNSSRREKRKASGKGTSLLIDLEDDFLDIEKNFKVDINPIFEKSTNIKTESEEVRRKSTTKLQQTTNKPTTAPTTKLQQTTNKVTTRKAIELAPMGETYNKLPTQPTTVSTTKLQQTPNKPTTNSPFMSLVGLQKKIVIFIYHLCRSQGARITDALSISSISTACQTSPRAAQETIRRLEQKGLVLRSSYKNGRGGWTKYELPEDVYKELFEFETYNKVTTNLQQTPSKLTTEPTTSSLSSSSYINTTTTEKTPAETFELESTKIPDVLKKYGFSENHLMQLKRDSKLPLESILNSIEAFAHDLGFEDVKRKIRSPIALIMKLLKAGEPYLSEKGYEAQEDRLFREYIQRAEKQKEEKNNLLQKFFDLKFEEWLEPMSDQDLLKISQPVGEFKGTFHLQQLKDHFKKEVFDGYKN